MVPCESDVAASTFKSFVGVDHPPVDLPGRIRPHCCRRHARLPAYAAEAHVVKYVGRLRPFHESLVIGKAAHVNLFPGWRFPATPYKNVRFENIKLIDTAASSVAPPIGNLNQPTNEGIVFKNVRVEMNHWGGAASAPLPAITGPATDASLEYSIVGDASRIVRSRKGSVEMTFQAAPATARVGAPIVLTWTSREAKQCIAGGSWSGTVGTSGTRTMNNTAAGEHEFTLTCQGDTAAAETKLRVAVSP
jgi:hypothetical protein